MDETTRRRLTLAKELYLRGLRLCDAKDELDRMIAVHSLHAAVETLLRAVAVKRSVPARGQEESTPFMQLVNALHKAMKPLPYRFAVEALARERNRVQHAAKAPEPSSMNDYRQTARDVLEVILQQEFDVSLHRLSRASFIHEERLRELGELAHGALDREDWDEATLCARGAFLFARRQALASLRAARPRGPPTRRLADLGYLLQNFDAIEDELLVIAAGIDLGGYRRLNEVTLIVVAANDRRGSIKVLGEGPVTEVQARHACSFVVDAILRWQAMGLEPGVPDGFGPGCDRFLDERREAGRAS